MLGICKDRSGDGKEKGLKNLFQLNLVHVMQLRINYTTNLPTLADETPNLAKCSISSPNFVNHKQTVVTFKTV